MFKTAVRLNPQEISLEELRKSLLDGRGKSIFIRISEFTMSKRWQCRPSIMSYPIWPYLFSWLQTQNTNIINNQLVKGLKGAQDGGIDFAHDLLPKRKIQQQKDH